MDFKISPNKRMQPDAANLPLIRGVERRIHPRMNSYVLSAVFARLLIFELFNLLGSIVAMSWKTAFGKIENREIHYNVDSEGTGLVVNNLEYSYLVSGNRYDSNRVRIIGK